MACLIKKRLVYVKVLTQGVVSSSMADVSRDMYLGTASPKSKSESESHWRQGERLLVGLRVCSRAGNATSPLLAVRRLIRRWRLMLVDVLRTRSVTYIREV